MKHKIFIHQWSALPMLLCVVLILHGCISSHKPPQSVGFKKIGDLKQLEGVYQNMGDPASPTLYLSQFIWSAKLNHSAITAVEVIVQSENTLLVKALRGDCIVIESTFIEGKDFDIREGRICLKRSVRLTGTEGGDPLAGVQYERIELGLDQEGHGKYKAKDSVAGLAFLMVPLAWTEATEVKFVKSTINENPRPVDAMELAQCKHDVGLYQESVEMCRQAILVKPDNGFAYQLMGVNYGKLGRYEEAIDAYKQAILMQPHSAKTYYDLCWTYDQLGLSQEAIEACTQAILMQTNNWEAYCLLGLNYGKLSFYEEAIDAYKKSILIQPNSLKTYYNLGWTCEQLGLSQEANAAYKQAVRILPNWSLPPCERGIALLKLGSYKEASFDLKRAISIKPDNADAHYYLGLTYLKMEKRKLALEEYDVLKNLDKDKADKLYDAMNR